MTDPAIDVIGKHVSDLPGAIPDVWPVIDGLGVVVELVRTWDDGRYVQLDHEGMPVDQIGQTHHLMGRAVFQETMLPREWTFVGARRVSRGLGKVRYRPAGARNDDTLGDGQEFEVLVELNAGCGTVTDEIDTCPPFTHVVELKGEFFLVQMRPAPEGSGEAGPGAPAAESAAAARRPAESASPEASPSDGSFQPSVASASDSVADLVEAVAAEEANHAGSNAAAVAERESAPIVASSAVASRSTVAPQAQAAPKGNAADLLKAIADPDDLDHESPGAAAVLQASVARPASGLASKIEEGVWEGPGDQPAPAAPAEASSPGAPQRAPTLLSEMPEDEDLESMRASSFAQATAFVTSGAAEASVATDGVLTLEQVREAGCFAWDEFMNLYLPHVGFVAAMPARTPGAGGEPVDVAFIPRSEADVRPIGWHHLAGCSCQYCQA